MPLRHLKNGSGFGRYALQGAKRVGAQLQSRRLTKTKSGLQPLRLSAHTPNHPSIPRLSLFHFFTISLFRYPGPLTFAAGPLAAINSTTCLGDTGLASTDRCRPASADSTPAGSSARSKTSQ